MKLGFEKQLLEIDKYGFPDKKKHKLISELYSDKIIEKKYNDYNNIIIRKNPFNEKYCDVLRALKGCPAGQLFASQKARRP